MSETAQITKTLTKWATKEMGFRPIDEEHAAANSSINLNGYFQTSFMIKHNCNLAEFPGQDLLRTASRCLDLYCQAC